MKIASKTNSPFISQASCLLLACAFGLVPVSTLVLSPALAAPAKTAAQDKESKEKEKAAKFPEPVIENVQPVTTEELVDKPHEYLKKNVKFTANFFAFSNLALDYKPAMRAGKDHLSFLILRPNSHIPFSEIKLAMALPKEKDPENQLLGQLKDGDELEITGNVFATALDEPWIDVLKLKKLKSAADDKKGDEKKSDDKKSGDSEPESTPHK